MLRTPRSHRIGTAVVTAIATTLIVAGATLAHPASEGDHPSSCIVTVEPGSVPVGGQFTVAGNFGGASIFLVRGTGGPAEDAQPNATTPESGSGFSVTFTAEAADVGDWTVHAFIPESECGDSDGLTVTAAPPNTAMPEPTVIGGIGLVLLLGGLLTATLSLRVRRT